MNVKPFLWPIFIHFSHNFSSTPNASPITGFHHLPEDVIIEILARLPVKSLLRFKRVCKSWYALIKTPSFVSRHLSFTPFEDTHVVINHWNHVTKGGFVSFLSNEQPVNKLITRDVPMSFFGDDVNVNLSEVFFYGPCNGIICVLGVLNHSATYSDHGPRAGDLIALWNPATREIKRLSSDSKFSRGNDYDFKVVKVDVGFGFDVKSNDYKVVRILNFWRNMGKYLVEVYDLRTGRWRKIDAVIPTTMLVNRAFSTYLNGFYYWWSADENVKSVLSFDFENEVFESIPAPALTIRSYVTLVNYNGSIALVAHDSSNLDFVVVWVLNKDGDNKTWTKLFNIMPDCFRFVGFSRIGAFYLVHGANRFRGKKNLVLYKPSTRQLTKLKLQVYEHTCSQLVNYAESLVSFK